MEPRGVAVQHAGLWIPRPGFESRRGYSMRVLHISDTHLGALTGPRYYPEQKEDSFTAFREALSHAEDHEIVVHTGDLFHHRTPSLETLTKAIEILKEVVRYGEVVIEGERREVPLIFAVHGNHDRNVEPVRNVYVLLERAGLITYVHRRVVEVGDVKIGGVGYIPKSYTDLVFKSFPSGVDIFLFHQAVKGVTRIPDEAAIPLDYLPEAGMYLGGHLHWVVKKEVSGRRIYIPGSTIVVSLSEAESEPRRVFSVREGEVSDVLLRNSRRLYIVEVDVSEVSKLDERISSVPREDPKPIVKVVVRGKGSLRLTEGSLREMYPDYLIFLYDKTSSVIEDLVATKESFESARLSPDIVEERFLSALADLGVKTGKDMNKFLDLLKEGKKEEAYELVKRGDVIRT